MYDNFSDCSIILTAGIFRYRKKKQYLVSRISYYVNKFYKRSRGGNLPEITEHPNSSRILASARADPRIFYRIFEKKYLRMNLISCHIVVYRHLLERVSRYLRTPVSIANCTVLRCIARRCKYNDERPTVLREHVAQSIGCGGALNRSEDTSIERLISPLNYRVGRSGGGGERHFPADTRDSRKMRKLDVMFR